MELFELLKLGDSFKRYFELVPALFEDLRDAAFNVRHQVYCEDLGYESVRPDAKESDEYDAHSLHCLLRSVGDGEYVGCTRLVLARPSDPHYPLPFERACRDACTATSSTLRS